jgi:hypothetical protein
MSGFVVDSRTLTAVGDTLGRLHDQLVGMHTVIWHQQGTLGGHGLESELERFCGTWHYGVAELGSQLHDLTRRLGEASAAYERIERRITHAASGSSGSGSGGAAVGPTGSGHTRKSAHHTAPKHASGAHHTAKHPDNHHTAPGGTRYSGGAPIAPTGGAGHPGTDKPSKGEKHPGVGSGTTVIGGGPDHSGGSDHNGGSRHAGGEKHNGSSGWGSGTTVIGGGPTGASHPGRPHPSGDSGSGTTVIGGGPAQGAGSRGGSGSGSGTTTIDEKIHQSEERQRAELASVLKVVGD